MGMGKSHIVSSQISHSFRSLPGAVVSLAAIEFASWLSPAPRESIRVISRSCATEIAMIIARLGEAPAYVLLLSTRHTGLASLTSNVIRTQLNPSDLLPSIHIVRPRWNNVSIPGAFNSGRWRDLCHALTRQIGRGETPHAKSALDLV